VGFTEDTTNKNDIFLIDNKFEMKEILNSETINIARPAPFKLFNCLDDRKAGRGNSALG